MIVSKAQLAAAVQSYIINIMDVIMLSSSRNEHMQQIFLLLFGT